MEDNNDQPKNTHRSAKLFSLKRFIPNLPAISSGYLMIGFLIVASVSAWLNLEQARTIDSIGDVVSANAAKEELNTQRKSEEKRLDHSETKTEEKNAIRKSIKKINDDISKINDDIVGQKQDVTENVAGMLNGSWFWTLLIQVGAAAFGIGIINLICSRKEDAMVRSAALIVIGAVVIFMLLSRIMIFSAAAEAAKPSARTSSSILR